MVQTVYTIAGGHQSVGHHSLTAKADLPALDVTNLNKQQLQYLKKLTHALKPIVRVGQHGVTEAVLSELDIALTHHELIKIKIGAADRDERQTMLSTLIESSEAELIQRIGGTAVLFRRNAKKPIIELPK